MRLSFYIKIFLAFILFSLILFMVFTLMFKSVYEKDFRKKERETILQAFEAKQSIFNQYAKNINKKLIALSQSEAYSDFLEDNKNEKAFVELLKLVLKSHKDIAQIKYLGLSGNEKIRLNNSDTSVEVVLKKDLQNRIIQDYCKNVRTLKEGETWYSAFEINKERGEISSPIYFIMRFVLKTPKGFISIIVNTEYILKQIESVYGKNSYILDKNGNFIVHKNPKYNWSEYLSGNETIHKLFTKQAKDILEKDELKNEEFISKRLYINSQEYIILLSTFEKNRYKEYFSAFKEYFFTLIVVGAFISIILALIFAKPINKLNEKTEEQNKNLDLTIKKNSEELTQSLNIIDKHVMSVQMDKDGVILDASTAFCDFTGFSKTELLGHNHNILMHPDTKIKEYELFWKKLKSGHAVFTELKGIKKDGGFYWVASNIEPIFDEEQKLKGFNAIRNNITDKKLIENLYSDINYQVQQYNAIFQNAHSGIGLIDLDGNFKRVNVVFSELLGYSSIELLQLNCFDIIHKSSKTFLEKLFVEAKEIGSISNIEKIFMHKEGGSIHLEMSLNLLPDKNHFVIVMNSLQDKRKLQELNQNLELRIKQEVEKSLEKDRIHQQEQIDNIKLKSIGSLAAGITHEINTPLTYIKGNFEMMGYDIEELPNSPIKTQMQEDSIRIKDGINRIANIVESMREISQSSSELKEKANIYSTIITALTMTFNRSKQISRVYLNQKLFDIDDIDKNKQIFMSEVQKQRVEQVWIVVINNALDELAKIEDYEKRVLHIYIKEEDEDIIILFEDNAGGIKKEALRTLFEPFKSSKEHSGMGVGLNISKKIIEQQNGKITAFNNNHGAVFEVRLKKCE